MCMCFDIYKNWIRQLSKKHRDGHMLKVDWLDRLTFREIEMINEKQKRDSKFMYLMIEFPFIHYDDVEYTVVYFEKVVKNGKQSLQLSECLATVYENQIL